MKILIISDLHGNAQALDVLPGDYDALWVLGDLVNYGPDPAQAVAFVRERASVVIRGNHDHAIGCQADPRCSKPYQRMADVMGRFTERALSNDDKAYLGSLPLTETRDVDGAKVFLCHAVPSDPLFAYCPPESDQWCGELSQVACDVLLCGHTHIPFVREINESRVANPGSLGQPKIGRAEACYAIWENGKIELHTVSYDYEETIRRIRKLGLPHDVEENLAHVLETGGSLVSATH